MTDDLYINIVGSTAILGLLGIAVLGVLFYITIRYLDSPSRKAMKRSRDYDTMQAQKITNRKSNNLK